MGGRALCRVRILPGLLGGVGGGGMGELVLSLVVLEGDGDSEDGGHDNSVRRKGPGSVGVYYGSRAILRGEA